MAKSKEKFRPFAQGPFRWIAVDPGVRCGYAIVEINRIIDVGTCAHDDLCVNRLDRIDCAVIEFPRVYPNQSQWKGDPQDIVRLAFKCGQIAEWYGEYTLIEPREWNGGKPKDVTWRRAKATLTQDELYVLPKRLSEHARDAIGIACWAMRRT